MKRMELTLVLMNMPVMMIAGLVSLVSLISLHQQGMAMNLYVILILQPYKQQLQEYQVLTTTAPDEILQLFFQNSETCFD